MLVFALVLSSAAAFEITLNATGSGTPQSALSTVSSTSSAPETITEIIIPASELSSLEASISSASAASVASASAHTTPSSRSSLASSTASSGVSPTITDGPIYTNDCSSYYGRNCDRLPEQPYWYGVTPGNPLGGFTPTAQQNPWAYYTSFLDYNLSSAAVSSAFSCSAVWYDSYTDWLATAPLTAGGVMPASTTSSTLSPTTVTETFETVTGTGTVTVTDTNVLSDGETIYSTTTETDAGLYSTSVSTYIVPSLTTEEIIYTAYTEYFYPSYSWKASAPCCSACTIYGGNIEVMYWPSTGLAGNKTTVVNSAGFTFTSPSIYMAVQTLSASDLCGQVGSKITTASTLSFAQNSLLTVPAYSSAGSIYTFYPFWSPTAYSPASFGTAPCTDETTVTAVDQITATVTYNPCYPYISIPPQIQTADPLWSTCTSQWDFLLYDPPYVISQAPGIGVFSSSSTTPVADSITSSPPTTSSTSPAAIGSTSPTIIAPTTTSTPAPPATTSVPSDPQTQPSSASVDPAQPSTSTLPVTVDPANPSPSTSPVAVNPTQTTSSALVVNPADPSNPTTSSPPAVVTIGSSIITANSNSGFVVGTQTLTPGGQLTVSGTTISLASNGATIAIGTSTQAIAAPTPAPTYVIGSQTLSAGGAAITVSGTVFSLQPGGSSVVVGGTTQALSALLGTKTSEYLVASGSQTLIAGGAAITVSGTVVSLQNDGSSVVVGGTTTEPLSAFLGSTTTSGLAGIIASVGGFGTSTSKASGATTGVSSYNGTMFTSDVATRETGGPWTWGLVLGAGLVVVGWL